MTSDYHKKIKEFINNANFSHLSFLEDVWSTSENKDYIGFYYFILSLKNENNEHVLDEIINREGSLSNAYLYLGRTAQHIYDSHRSTHISLNFYRKAIEADSLSSAAHWCIYQSCYDIKYLIKSLEIDYQNKDISQIKQKINHVFNSKSIDTLSKEDLLFLKKIYTIPDSNKGINKNDVLVLIYFLLDDFDSGIEIIRKTSYLDADVIKKYYDNNLIDFDMAVSKVHFYNIDQFLLGDHKNIYEFYKKEAKKGELNPTKDVLIHKAYLADQFLDVINYYEEEKEKNALNDKLKSSLYYLLSQTELNQNIDNKTYEFVKDQFYQLTSIHRDDDTNNLNLLLQFKLLCLDIKKLKTNSFDLNFPIEMHSSFQKALKILDKPEIVSHNLYGDLKQQLISLKEENIRESNHIKLNNLKNYDIETISNHLDLINFCSPHINSGNYDFVIKTILDFHKTNTPSMSSLNCLGVCYDYNKDYINALNYYKYALDLMHSSKEQNYQIIQNYLNCYKNSKFDTLSEGEYEELKNEFNLSLVNTFKWNYSSSDRFNILFKYSPFNINTIDSLANQYFYLPSKRQLNDPIELPDLDKITPDSLIYKDYYICSFSNNENSMLMWSHYAEQHKGIMVEYWFGGELPNGFGISKVDYLDDKKRLKEKDTYVFNQFLLTKNKDWDYENEVRVFTFLKNKVEFTTYDYLKPDRSKINANIRSITLGLQFPEDKKKLIGNLVQALNNKLSPYEQKILVRQAFMSEDNNFTLEYKDIELD
ncbi:DUF2971 domain-containing protein [Acinetobacter sp. TTH0-4]|uniref:DUF2971 domain-containing protein n=1 Tax=Acinetobacter sp. TTH0-4 TaxID=1646498 RepID=UPI00189DC46B|nr:DUF2971 domain-containing protein [Acinetobacter sp. TTH0-4]QPF39129.1 DUF2971 domain-containing protein [Acinetobacter sp. TTH0-4]